MRIEWSLTNLQNEIFSFCIQQKGENSPNKLRFYGRTRLGGKLGLPLAENIA